DNMRFYSGFIQSFSDNGEDEDEYFLRNVNVYKYKNETIGDLLFSSPGIYLNRKRENLVFEFPNMNYIEVPTVTTRKKRKKCCLLLRKMLILKRRRKSNGKN
ncbi:MAG: hypothetical protein KAR20_10995, partial [Candidatus Heimdallarchaeota archaeon]|nr:hypothetical protein [Candidatus Heimdallarchaeota archaeon]